MPFVLSDLVASAANSLLGHVAPALRAYMVDFDEQTKTIHSYFIYDQNVDDFLFDLGSCTSTEVISSLLCEDVQFSEDHFTYLQYPNKIPFKGHLIYLRYESNLEEHYPNVRYAPLLKKTDYLYAPLFLDMQNALLAKVTPSLREVSATIHDKEKIIDLYFFYDGPISKLDHDLASLAGKSANASLLDFSVRTMIKRCDFPQRVSSVATTERCIYARYEDTNLLTDK